MSFLFSPSSSSALPAPVVAPILSKASLTHLTPMMISSSSRALAPRGSKHRKGKGIKSAALAKDGESISKFFNLVAGRPYPSFSRLNQVVRLVDTYSVTTFIVTNASTPSGAATGFALSSFPNVTEYTNAFDQYRIDQLEVWLELVGNQDAALGTLVTAVDLDDANVPTGPTQIQDKQGALVGSGAAMRYHRWVPHVAVAEYSGAFTSYGNVPATWIDTASPGVLHWGFKTAAAAYTVASYNLTVRAVISFSAPGL